MVVRMKLVMLREKSANLDNLQNNKNKAFLNVFFFLLSKINC